MKAKFNEVFELIHQTVELALKAKELAKEATLETAKATKVFNEMELKRRVKDAS